MRYDTPIYFQRFGKPKYDPSTGDYDTCDVTEMKRYASVTDSGIETMRLIYGDLKQGSKVVRLQREHNGEFDRIRIGDKCYRVDLNRNNKAFVVSEVQ